MQGPEPILGTWGLENFHSPYASDFTQVHQAKVNIQDSIEGEKKSHEGIMKP